MVLDCISCLLINSVGMMGLFILVVSVVVLIACGLVVVVSGRFGGIVVIC